MSQTKIVLNRQSDLILDNATITTPQGIVLTDVSGVSEAVASIDTRFELIISNVDETALDSLSEIVTAFQAADGDLNGAISELGSAAGSGLSTEILDRVAGDESLAANLSTEVLDRVAGDEYLQSQLDNLAQTDGLTLDVDLTNNTIILKDTVAAPISGIRTFEGLINVGTQPADSGAFNNLSLVTKKFVEDADASIMSIVNNVISNIDPSALDSLSELVTAFQSADNELSGTITDLVNAATTNLNTEVDARISAVASLDDKIEAFPLADNLTIEVDGVDNIIKLKDTIAAPLSGIRTFEGLINVGAQPSDNVAFNDLSLVTKKFVEDADASIEQIYAKRVSVNETPDDSIATFTLASAVKEGSDLVYVNGLLYDSEDYTANLVDGKVTSITFVTIPSVGDKVRAYGVY